MREASVTVVIPVHNGETFVSDALSAALSQRHQPGEAIVVNDGSGGGRAVSCAPFRPEIRIVRRSHRGFSATYKRGVALVRGDHAARCNADDTWESNLLERQCSALREHRRIDIAAGAAWMFGLEERMFANLVREDGRLGAWVAIGSRRW